MIAVVLGGIFVRLGREDVFTAVEKRSQATAPVVLIQGMSPAGLELPQTLPGTLRLEAGEATVRLLSGVALTLLGPVALEVRDAMQVRLHVGRLLAEVPAEASGFIVNTPELEIWDIGTVFGVAVSGGASDVFVFKGEVQVNEASGESVDLCCAGEGVRARRGQKCPIKFAADWDEARRMFASVRERAALVSPAATFETVDKIASLWNARYMPEEASSLNQRRMKGSALLSLKNKTAVASSQKKEGRTMRGLLKTAATATMVMLTSVPTSEAVDTYWIPASGYWDAAGNWDNGLPTSANNAYVASAAPARTATITNGVAAVADWLCIAYGASSRRGDVVMTGGSLTAARIHMSQSSCVGSFTLSDGTVSVTDARIGMNATGNFMQKGGSVSGAYWVIGHYASSRGTYDQSGGTATLGPTAIDLGLSSGALGVYRISGDSVLNAAGGFRVNVGTGLIEQNGGTINSGLVNLGNSAGSKGMLQLNGGTFNGSSSLYVGSAGWGSVTQFAGSATFSDLNIANAAGGSGTYTLFGGSLSSIGSQRIGYKGVGAFEQHAGTNSCGAWCTIGLTNDIPGSYVLKGGTLQSAYIVIGGNYVGASNAVGEMTFSDGSVFCTSEISVGRYGQGMLTQAGGELVCPGSLEIGMRPGGFGVYTQAAGVARLNGVVLCKDEGSVGRYVITGGMASMTNLTVGNYTGREAVLNLVGANAAVTIDGQMTIGASGTYEVTLTPEGFRAPHCGTLTLSSLASLRVNAAELLPHDMDNTEITIVTFGTAPASTFKTVTVETGSEDGKLRSATVNYYPDRITLSVRVVRPPQGTVVNIL